MTRCRGTFKKGDVRKALEAVKAAGEHAARVEIDQNGKVIVVIGNPAGTTETTVSEWDAKYGKA